MGLAKKIGLGTVGLFVGIGVIGAIADPNPDPTVTASPTRGLAWQSSTPGPSPTATTKPKATKTAKPNAKATKTPRPKPSRTSRPDPTETPFVVPTEPPVQETGYSWPSADVDCDEISYDYANWLLDQNPSDPFRLDRDHDGEACERSS